MCVCNHRQAGWSSGSNLGKDKMEPISHSDNCNEVVTCPCLPLLLLEAMAMEKVLITCVTWLSWSRMLHTDSHVLASGAIMIWRDSTQRLMWYPRTTDETAAHLSSNTRRPSSMLYLWHQARTRYCSMPLFCSVRVKNCNRLSEAVHQARLAPAEVIVCHIKLHTDDHIHWSLPCCHSKRPAQTMLFRLQSMRSSKNWEIWALLQPTIYFAHASATSCCIIKHSTGLEDFTDKSMLSC